MAEHSSYQPLSYVAYYKLRQNIIYCDLVPGQKISAKEIEERLALGRTPVREALVRLAESGLIYTVPQSGTYITHIDLKHAEDARFMREHLESRVIVDCCARLTDADKATLENVIAQQEDARTHKDARAFFEHDNRFHEAIFEIAGHRNVWLILEAHNAHLQRFRWLRTQVESLEWSSIMDQHYQMLAAIVERRPDEASYLATAHTHLMISERDTVTKAFPDYFDLDQTEAGTSCGQSVSAYRKSA